ncbi:MAG: putative bifunctional diguanylate cyclase/phosphodiesterase [Mycobacteriales bacterium]
MTGTASAPSAHASLPRLMWVLVVAMALAAVTAVAVSLPIALLGPMPVWWQFVVCVAMFALVSLAWFSVRVGSHLVLIGWTEVAVVLGLVLLPPAWVVVAIALGCGAKFVGHRDQPVKAIYNASMDTVAAAVVVGLVGLLAHPPLDVGRPGDIFELVLAAVLYSQLTEIGTAAAVGLSQQRSVFSVYRGAFGINLLSEVGNVATSLLVVGLVHFDERALLVLPVVLLSLRQVYLGRVRAREERESWQGLLDATRAMADLDERVVLARAASEATRLFGADGAEIELADGRLVRGDERGVGYDGAAGEAPPREAGAVLERPIGPEAGPLGVLRLCFAETVTLNDREQAMLGAVAAELHSALVNAAQHATARHEATHDPLTDLLNRAGLVDRGRGSLAGAVAAEVDAAVVLIHISGFREIVDTLGHAAGDSVLLHTARRLDAAVLPGELVARLEGDEFAVLLPKLTDPAQASHRAETLLGAVASPALIGGAGLTLAGVAGIAYSPRGEVALDELLRQAGVALHAVHSSVGRIDFYAPERDVRSVSRLVLASELRAALQGMGQLDLVYQPILDLHTGEAIAAEAKVRWHHPARGDLAPEEFMPVVEHAGLLPDLTRRVLDIALGSAADWTRHGIGVPVAINVSPRTLLDRDFPGEVAAALSRHRVPAGRLSLEITETSVVSHLAVVDRVLDELRDLGVRLALDDFGTGWSSLSHLARLPVHEVKIAATFTDRLLSSPQAAAVVRGTLEIARALDLRVVAEGVTGAIQRATLISLGCHAGQGDHLFPPLPADRIGPALWSSSVRAQAVSDGADIIPLAQRRPNRE